MVLPTPPPDDASGAHEPAFVERLKRILQLADRGVLMLVEGEPHALGPIVRGLLPDYPDLLVETRAERLFTAEKGQVVVFVPNLDEAASLNLNRPILSERELKVVLVCDEATSGKLAHAAPDFFHWISHWLKGPKGPLPEAVARLREAVARRPIKIAWAGTLEELNATFDVVLPGARLEMVSSKSDLDCLIATAKPRPKTWVVWTDVDHDHDLSRLQIAWRRAGRGGRNLLVSSSGQFPKCDEEVIQIDATVVPLADAIDQLRAVGADNAGRLAALADLSRASIEKITALLGEGYSPSRIETRLASTSRPWDLLDARNRLHAERTRHPHGEIRVDALAQGLLDLATYMERRGMFAMAEQLLRDGIRICEELAGIDDARTRAAVAQLSQLLKARGRYGDAIVAWLKVLPDGAKEPGPLHPKSHWLHEEDVKAAGELLFLVSRLQNLELARRAHRAVRGALGDEAKETKALGAWVERLSAPKDA